jgi:hypothetical protein
LNLVLPCSRALFAVKVLLAILPLTLYFTTMPFVLAFWKSPLTALFLPTALPFLRIERLIENWFSRLPCFILLPANPKFLLLLSLL